MIAALNPGGEYILEALYDIGLRKGEIIIINPGTFADNSFYTED